MVNSLFFMGHANSEKQNQFNENSPYGGGWPGFVARRSGNTSEE